MLHAAQVYHTQSHNLTAQSNSFGCTSSHPACAITVCLEVASTDSQERTRGGNFFCVLKENLNG